MLCQGFKPAAFRQTRFGPEVQAGYVHTADEIDRYNQHQAFEPGVRHPGSQVARRRGRGLRLRSSTSRSAVPDVNSVNRE